MVNGWIDWIQIQLFPATCILCGGAGHRGLDLCHYCHQELARNSVACLQCGLPLPFPGYCGRCQQQPPAFDYCVAPFLYQGGMRELITGLKFGAKLQAARLLGRLLAEALQQRQQALPQLVLPVPLHPSRIQERGFNQAFEVAKAISKTLPLPIDVGLCERSRSTVAQSSLSRRDRQTNLKKAFTLQERPLPDHVVLLDDVVTTGATANELALVLKQHGAARVGVWCVARTT